MSDTTTFLGDFKFSREELTEIIKERDEKRVQELGGVAGIAQGLGSDLKNGLSDHEATHGFVQRKTRYGENVFPQKPPKPIWVLIWEALQDRTLQILIVASVVSIILGVFFGHGKKDDHAGSGSMSMSASGSASESNSASGSGSDSSSFAEMTYRTMSVLGLQADSGGESTEGSSPPGWLEGVAILIAVALVVTVTAMNDYNKEKQFRKLSAQNDDQMVKAKRAGKATTVNIADIVVGDVVLLEAGDTIPADGIYIHGFTLHCDESAMTGEPELVPKDDEEDPFLLSNCRVMDGRGEMLVVAVGPYSQWGVIKAGLDTEHEDTPLQEKLETLAENIGKMGLVAAALTLVALVINRIVVIEKNDIPWTWDELSNLVDYIIIGVTIIVVAVPEGLPLAVTISLAYSMRKMMADQNLVRHLAACETMGGATNICSDKTGTLTENRMTLTEGWLAGRGFKAENPGEWPQDVQFLFCESVALNSSAYIEMRNGVKDYVGNKTECALLDFVATKMNFDWESARNNTEIEKVFPFSSSTKQMSTVVKAGSDRVRLHKKGAPEGVIANCSHLLDPSGQIVPFTEQSRAELLRSVEDMASNGLRTLGLAYAEYLAPVTFDKAPDEGLICLGIVGIKDPVRKEVPPAVALCKRAGITVRMVTGDNILTAEHIAKECGILSEDGICIEGPKFRKLSTAELDKMLPRLQVIARASPEDKLKLVQRLKALGEVVASTGDGTNDALQLKEADVGFAMGITGTGVAKEASDIILLDDNFASIAKACMWGRNVYDSIRKFLQFQLTVNVGAVVIAFIGAVVPSIGDSPLSAVQMLWVNLIMDTMAALALATEAPSPRLLERPPYGRYDSLITNSMWRMIIGMCVYQLTVLFVLLFAVQHFSFAFGDIPIETPKGKLIRETIIFNTFVLCQLVNEINCRKLGDELNVFSHFLSNYLFIAILAVSLGVQILLVQIPNDVVPSSSLSLQQWISCSIIALLSLPYAFLLKVLIKVPADKINKGPEAEEQQPLLSSNRSIIPIFSKWSLARRVVKELRVINALRRYRR